MTKLNQTNLERTKSEVLIKIANMLMELDNENFTNVYSTCNSIQKELELFADDKRREDTPGDDYDDEDTQ